MSTRPATPIALFAAVTLAMLTPGTPEARTPTEQFDLDCVVAGMHTYAQEAGGKYDQTAENAFAVEQFYEGRLTARDETTNWRAMAKDEVRPFGSMGDLATIVACIRREAELLQVPTAD